MVLNVSSCAARAAGGSVTGMLASAIAIAVLSTWIASILNSRTDQDDKTGQESREKTEERDKIILPSVCQNSAERISQNLSIQDSTLLSSTLNANSSETSTKASSSHVEEVKAFQEFVTSPEAVSPPKIRVQALVHHRDVSPCAIRGQKLPAKFFRDPAPVCDQQNSLNTSSNKNGVKFGEKNDVDLLLDLNSSSLNSLAQKSSHPLQSSQENEPMLKCNSSPSGRQMNGRTRSKPSNSFFIRMRRWWSHSLSCYRSQCEKSDTAMQRMSSTEVQKNPAARSVEADLISERVKPLCLIKDLELERSWSRMTVSEVHFKRDSRRVISDNSALLNALRRAEERGQLQNTHQNLVDIYQHPAGNVRNISTRTWKTTISEDDNEYQLLPRRVDSERNGVLMALRHFSHHREIEPVTL